MRSLQGNDMHFIAKMIRLIHILFVLLKYDLDKLVWSLPICRPFYIFIIFFPWRWFGARQLPAATSIRLALEELGPIFVKFGQLLSTRRDLLSEDIADELAKLQDQVPPFPSQLAQQIIEQSLQQPIDQLFAEFQAQPLASASISQVHSATLPEGKQIVVKVLRPKIAQLIRRDVEVLQLLAACLQKYVPPARRLRPVEVVTEFKCILDDEIDLLREAANASQLRRNFAHNNNLYVPEIYWPYCRQNILVMERVHGIPIADIAALKANNTNLKRLAEQGVEIFFTQVFRDCFFHADMHPGNIFVSVTDPEQPCYIAVDFGIMGTLGPEDQHYLGENFLAFFKRDYRRVAELHVQSGWIPPDTRIESFESAIRGVCEPIFERPLKDISFGQTLLRLFQTARRFDMEIQPQLVLLQKTLLTVEGLGRQLYPDLDLWHTAKPFLEKWMKQHYGWRGFYRNVQERFPQWIDKLPEMPEAIHDIVSFWQNETRNWRYRQPTNRSHTQEKIYLSHLKEKKDRTTQRIFGATLIICATLVATLNEQAARMIADYAFLIIGLGLGVGVYCLFNQQK